MPEIEIIGEIETSSSEDAMFVQLNSRIDNIIALNNDTEGNSELIDIRTGTDGVVYESAGQAVRNQVTSIKTNIENIYTAVHNYADINIATQGAITPYIIEYIKWHNGEQTPHDGFRSFRFDVSATDSVTADTVTRSGTDTYVLLKENNIIAHEELTGGIINGITINTSEADTLILCVYNGNENIVSVSGTYVEPNIGKEISVSEIQDGYFYQRDTNKPVSTYENIIYDISEKTVVYLNHHIEDAVSNVYTVLDANDNVIGYSAPQGGASEEKPVKAANYPIYVGNAKKLAISHLKSSVYYPSVFGVRKTTKETLNELEQRIKSIETDRLKETLNEFERRIKIIETNPFENKKIVWFGTSIPAGKGGIGLTSDFAYPQMVGDILNANVVNEAVGESSIHCRSTQRVTNENPYGFEDNWIKCAKCLSNTIEETQWLIDHKDDYRADGSTRIFTTNRPESLSESDIEFYLSCSYENKIKKHLSDTDLWVFDHGHNDRMDANHNGNGVYIADEQIMETYGDDTTFTFQGAMNLLLTYIKNADHKAKIIIIGEYENQKMYKVPPKQMAVADSWNIPICKLWENIGWSQHTITTTGYWDSASGLWIEDGGEPQTITLLQRFVRDNIHPHSDASGYALNHIAENITNWLLNIRCRRHD